MSFFATTQVTQVPATVVSAAPTDVTMEDAQVPDTIIDADGNERPRKRWERPGGQKFRKKKNAATRNRKIRRYVKPKNAVVCLNELQTGLIYTTEQIGTVQMPFCVSVEVNGQKFRGYGSSKLLARQAAAEAALISFVKPPAIEGSNSTPATSASPEEGGAAAATAETDVNNDTTASSEAGASTNTDSVKDTDRTPWATIASFAMYKLFNNWREGRVGMYPPPPAFPAAVIRAGVQSLIGAGPDMQKQQQALSLAMSEAFAQNIAISGETPKKKAEEKRKKAVKTLPENANMMHPVTVLHQMKPNVVYTNVQTLKDSKPFYELTTVIDDQNFNGEGTTVKKAKFNLAKNAIKVLFNVESAFPVPN